jgi:hypothetical protein
MLLTVTIPSGGGVAQARQHQDGVVGTHAQDTTYAKQRSEGEVTLEIWPQWQGSQLIVEVKANTHSVDLSKVDLETQVRLIVGDSEYTPTQTGSLTGHHAGATLVFQLVDRPSSFTIEIRDVPDVPLRVLTWPIGQAASW